MIYPSSIEDLWKECNTADEVSKWLWNHERDFDEACRMSVQRILNLLIKNEQMVKWLAKSVQGTHNGPTAPTYVCPQGREECEMEYNCERCWITAAEEAIKK